MSTLAEIIAGIRAALGRSGEARQAVTQAGEMLDEAIEQLSGTLSGSRDPDAEQAVQLMAHARAEIDEIRRTLAEADNGVDRYLGHLGVASGAPEAVRSTSTDPTIGKRQQGSPVAPPLPVHSAVPREHVERLRRELPPDVLPLDKRPADEPRRKTHGRWVGPDGQAHPIVSGEDEMYGEAVKAFPALGLRRGLPRRASDVEMKLAAYMRNRGIHSATVVINNTPCSGPFGCDELVPVLLPKGFTLTVYGADNFAKTYHGGATPPWRH